MKQPAQKNALKKPKPSTEESLKETFESIIIAFILAFVFRAFVVEAFVIPTGSMAPTLLGEHLRIQCQQCGYQFNADPEDRDRSGRTANRTYIKLPHLSDEVKVACPMCKFTINKNVGVRINKGDRILVHKFIYNFSDPKRWDVVVFKNPEQPQVNYIKRLVGLPNENLWIIEGNVYTQPKDSPDAPWKIARKTEVESAQRAVWQPVYHSQYIPLDKGNRPGLPNWTVPWSALKGKWQLENRRNYLHNSSDTGVIKFNYLAMFNSRVGQYAYNHLKNSNMVNPYDAIEDIRVGATFEPLADGLELKLQTTARIDHTNKSYILAATINTQGNIQLTATHPDTKSVTNLASDNTTPFKTSHGRRVELWFVDQQLSLWIDNQKVAACNFEIPIDILKQRKPLDKNNMPDTRIEVSGAPVIAHLVNVDRDIIYASPTSTPRRNSLGLGTLHKNNPYRYIGDPVTIDADQFYCLGDNSPASSDSRYWSTVNPWIKKRMLADRLPDPSGVVPRKLMMGKAFFVYWPAAYGLSNRKIAVLPNFGDMRFIK